MCLYLLIFHITTKYLGMKKSLGEDFLRGLCHDKHCKTLIEWERSEAHATRGCDGCQKGCESGYYDLHRYLDDAFLHPLPPFLALRSGLLADPVVERSHLLDVLLLGGILLLGSDVNLLLDAISAQRTHILEGSRSDVIIADALRTEADVHALHVGIRVPLTLQQSRPRDTLLGALYRRPEDTQTVDLDGVALCDELDHAARHLDEHTLDDVSTIHALVLAHVLGQTSERDGILLYCLGIILAVTGVVGVDVLTNVNQKLWILYHN